MNFYEIRTVMLASFLVKEEEKQLICPCYLFIIYLLAEGIQNPDLSAIAHSTATEKDRDGLSFLLPGIISL